MTLLDQVQSLVEANYINEPFPWYFVFNIFFLDVAWFKQSESITKSAKYWIHRRKDCHLLTIFDVMAEDCGSYSCVAFNNSSELWHSIELTVKGRREN